MVGSILRAWQVFFSFQHLLKFGKGKLFFHFAAALCFCPFGQMFCVIPQAGANACRSTCLQPKWRHLSLKEEFEKMSLFYWVLFFSSNLQTLWLRLHAMSNCPVCLVICKFCKRSREDNLRFHLSITWTVSQRHSHESEAGLRVKWIYSNELKNIIKQVSWHPVPASALLVFVAGLQNLLVVQCSHHDCPSCTPVDGSSFFLSWPPRHWNLKKGLHQSAARWFPSCKTHLL